MSNWKFSAQRHPHDIQVVSGPTFYYFMDSNYSTINMTNNYVRIYIIIT